MKNFKNNKILVWTVEILLVLSIIFMSTKIDFLFHPLFVLASTVFAPLLLAGFLYYMLSPLLQMLMKVRISKESTISRTWAAAIVFLGLLAVIALILATILPRINAQIVSLIRMFPTFAKHQEQLLIEATRHGWLKDIDWNLIISKLQSSYTDYLANFYQYVTNNAGNYISFATSLFVTLLTAPVILFYMLKDGDKFLPSIRNLLPGFSNSQWYKTETLLKKLNYTLSRYISGQIIECLFTAVFTTAGYFLIGQKYALVLGVFGGFCALIPYVGPYIGIIPALMISVTTSISQVIMTIIVVMVVNLVDGNLIYPNVIGKVLNIHPLTIIIILLVAGNLAGVLGMMLSVPLYAIIKEVVHFLYDVWTLKKQKLVKE
ncbi:AI-2E family transporter [Convivina praedatoris]|uniref:AI-2E family transporter n=1 Tax=Convivina praedatoris TaxID=2880963 RepID=A0ABM9D318_9LACO|nr:AI-2E family transporter [Convivina sp. LMG 32447]CAH1855851.1 hypothetical protein R077815_01291 [Convivina sp. LMG 32447]CAH1856658.1 hypothetical protein LMG032447_01339 [Convivina sp. LMG 32447]CAH1856826.1 hypothetical protein R078138_01444 [Convivina sp. LMG 32447]